MGKRIPKEDAKKLCENWTGSKEPGNGRFPGKALQRAGFTDTFETWFSVEELQKYLDYVKSEISDNPGIRIYFGNYGKNVGPKDESTTVFLAPTRGGDTASLDSTEIENDYDLDPYNSGQGGHPPVEYDPNP